MPYTIMLDSGHGGRDPGAVYKGRQEKDDALRLVLAIGEILQDRGIDVLYTRTEDLYESPFEKAMEANTADADFFLSIHRNSYPTDNTVSGVESLIYDKSGIKFEMAENINEQLEAIGFVNLGVKERPNLVVLKRTRMPAILVEVGFINSDTDNQLFDENFQDIAEAIAAGIIDTLDLDPVETAAVSPSFDDASSAYDTSMNSTPSATPSNSANSVSPPNFTDTDPISSISDTTASLEPDKIEFTDVATPASKTFTSQPSKKDPSTYPYHVQVGAFRTELYANRLLEELMEQNFPAFLVHTGNIYRVYVGAFSSLEDAVKMERLLKRVGYPTVIIA